MVKDMTTTTGFAKKRPKHWGKAVPSIAVTLVAMPLTHLLVRLLRNASWGISLRHGFATVIILWISVEVFNRIQLLPALWNAPGEHLVQIGLIAGSLIATALYVSYRQMFRKV